MKTGNITNTFIPFLLLVLCSNCDQKKGASSFQIIESIIDTVSLKDPNHYKNQDSVLDLKTIKEIVNKKTGPFDPVFFFNKHVALVYAISGDSIIGPNQEVNIKMGKMPKGITSHAIKVLYLNPNGNVLDSFNLPHPFFGRLETGYNKGLQRISRGFFEVPVPVNHNIATVLMLDGTDTISQQNVFKMLQDAFKILQDVDLDEE